MSIVDPRALIPALEDLDEELRRWVAVAAETLSEAQRTQRQAHELIERIKYRAAVIRDQVERDQFRVVEASTTVKALIGKCMYAVQSAQNTLKDTRIALQNANTTLNSWSAELQKAIEWLKRAQARLQRAIAEYEAAQRAFAAAQRELNSAISSLRNCANNTERRDCRSEHRRVERAQIEVRETAARVEIAKVEVLAARAEVERAQTRVNCCTEAVKNATLAVSHASIAVQNADEALNNAERSLEYSRASERAVQQAEKHFQDEQDEAEQMMLAVQSGERFMEDAFVQLKSAERMETSARRQATDVSYELDYRVEKLIAFNRPEQLLDTAGVSSASFTGQSSTPSEILPVVNTWLHMLSDLGGGHGWRYQKARQAFLTNLVDDENQPSYVRGWIKQELNRIERTKQAEMTGDRPPGGNKRHLRGVPGLDVGHVYPDIDLPENFRLEEAAMNRARPGIARRLGLSHIRR